MKILVWYEHSGVLGVFASKAALLANWAEWLEEEEPGFREAAGREIDRAMSRLNYPVQIGGEWIVYVEVIAE